MKKALALLLCLLMIAALISCDSNESNTDPSTNDTEDTALVSSDDHTTETKESGTEEQPSKVESPENKIAMQAFQAAIHDEICVIDEQLGEIKLKDLRFTADGTSLDEYPLLQSAELDLDQDGVDEYVIQSPTYDCIILRYYNGKVYSYRLDTRAFYKFNTDGTFYWYDSSSEGVWACGFNQAFFNGKSLTVKSVYSLKHSNNKPYYEYFVEETAVTEDAYYDHRENYHLYMKTEKRFTPFELTCAYPITANQAWNLANAYWDSQDGRSEGDMGCVYVARIVLIDTPNSETDDYRFAFHIKRYSGGAQEGYECMPPSVREHDQILVNAFTGKVTASTYKPDGKEISLEEAIEIARNHCEPAADKSGTLYRIEQSPSDIPEHIYYIIIYKRIEPLYAPVWWDVYTSMWIDKYTGEIVFSYYLYGK